MRSRALLLVAAALAMVACSREVHRSTRQKLAAPILIEGDPGLRSVNLKITFLADADDVETRVYGTGGLVVTGDRWSAKKDAFRAGDRLEISVEYASPPVDSTLSVTVVGSYGEAYGGARLGQEQTFIFGR